LPVLVMLFGGAIDLARVCRVKAIVTSCACAGAVYGSSSTSSSTNTSGIQQAALVDANDLSPQPTITSSTQTSGGYTTVSVTATYSFQPLTGIVGIPNPWSITRTVNMQVSP
jgi:Flp pilus assembly protein TadG